MLSKVVRVKSSLSFSFSHQTILVNNIFDACFAASPTCSIDLSFVLRRFITVHDFLTNR